MYAPVSVCGTVYTIRRGWQVAIRECGFRNPYRFSFDIGGTHQLFVGGAGQDLYEEVSIVTNGGNYGWNIKEGTHCFNPQDEKHSPEHCRDTGYMGEPLVDPVIEYNHPQEEEYVLVKDTLGPTGQTGKVYKLTQESQS